MVIDTNVLAVAEGMNPDASDACRAACTELLRCVQTGQIVAVDDAGLAISEYISVLKRAKTSGIGSKLAVALARRQHDPRVCRKIAITPCDTPPGSFEEVPDGLRDFDLDDHKWIAIANADDTRPQVFQALDGEWWDRQRDFVAHGIDVQFLCATDLLARD